MPASTAAAAAAATGAVMMSSNNNITRRRIPGGSSSPSRDSYYFMIFITMMAYHFYSNYSVLMIGPSVPTASKVQNDAEASSLLPSSPASPTRTIANIARDDESATIPLDILTVSTISQCNNNGLVYLPNRILNHTIMTISPGMMINQNMPRQGEGVYYYSPKIPKIVHITSKSRCFTPNFVENIQKWEFPDHDMYIHDDEAVERLLSKHWPSFPHIPIARKCLRSGAGLADLWRYLVLWEYGGIYTGVHYFSELSKWR